MDTPNGKRKIGVALSGGGYRAAAFHLGTLKALRKLNILEKVNVFSTISGGSIIGAFYCLHQNNFEEFEKELRKSLQRSVITGVILSRTFLRLILITATMLLAMGWLLFKPYAWGAFVLLVLFIMFLLKFQFKLFPLSKVVEEMYDRFFFKGKMLKDLTKNFTIAINATNLETARLFTFSREKMEDSFYSYAGSQNGKGRKIFNHDDFPIAKAVAASTCVPFAFTPVKVAPKFFIDNEDAKKYKPRLVDGGVYDNQGLHKLTQASSSYCCNTIIVSDAGLVFPFQSIFPNTIALLIRVVDIFMRRIKNIQFADNIYQNITGREIAYFSLSWDIEKCIPDFIENYKKGNIPAPVLIHFGLSKDFPSGQESVIKSKIETMVGYSDIPKISKEDVALARGVSTNLTALSQGKINALVKCAEAMTELQVKLYCPSILS